MPLNRKILIEISLNMGAHALSIKQLFTDVDGGSVMAGQIAGLVSKEEKQLKKS